NWASPYANTAPSAAAIQPPRAVAVRATPTARVVTGRVKPAPPSTVVTRPLRSTPNVGTHADVPGGAPARGAAYGGGGIEIEANRGPSISPSRFASDASNVLTLYEPTKPPSPKRVVTSTIGL